MLLLLLLYNYITFLQYLHCCGRVMHTIPFYLCTMTIKSDSGVERSGALGPVYFQRTEICLNSGSQSFWWGTETLWNLQDITAPWTYGELCRWGDVFEIVFWISHGEGERLLTLENSYQHSISVWLLETPSSSWCCWTIWNCNNSAWKETKHTRFLYVLLDGHGVLRLWRKLRNIDTHRHSPHAARPNHGPVCQLLPEDKAATPLRYFR